LIVFQGDLKGLGNIFNVLEKYDLAEKYLLKSIKEDSSDTASDYLTLSDLEQKRLLPSFTNERT